MNDVGPSVLVEGDQGGTFVLDYRTNRIGQTGCDGFAGR
jgi:hypothetical protein